MEYNQHDVMSQMEDVSSIIKGGLKVVYPLPDMPLHPIFTKIVEANFDVSAMEPELQESTKCVINGLFERPMNLSHFVTKQRLYIALSWAHDRLELENMACEDCDVKVVDETNGVYKIQLAREFCAHYEIRTSSLLRLMPNDAIYPFFIRGRAVDFHEPSSTLTFVPFGRAKTLKSFKSFRVSMIPSPLVFRSRARTLNWLQALGRDEIIFPKPIETTISRIDYERAERNTIPHMNFSRSLDKYQKRAVYAIVSGHHATLPYIVHGPPGTGKTTVLVEAIRQLLADPLRSVRILVCAPSNTAADVIALELLKQAKVGENEVFRMYSLLRPVAMQNRELRCVSCICKDDEDEDVFGIPPIEHLMQKRVIVCTLGASTFLISGNLHGKFTHIIIDEAGQANEIDTLIPMVGLGTPETRIVLAGDPKQLGPVEPIDFLNKNNIILGSLMERFAMLPCYCEDRRFSSMLERNYRSHATIVKVPSDLFYDSRLVASRPKRFDQKSALSKWEVLPRQDFPIIFQHVAGEDELEPGGFSYCNMEECDKVVEYVGLIAATLDVRLEDIGVISPYKYQVRKIREALESCPGITVDTVERYQGSERRIIIVSCVRHDHLGFVGDEKRFNTTVMRAEELLIVIGNCIALSRNIFWRSFINYCDDNGAIKNRPIVSGCSDGPKNAVDVGMKNSNGSSSFESDLF